MELGGFYGIPWENRKTANSKPWKVWAPSHLPFSSATYLLCTDKMILS